MFERLSKFRKASPDDQQWLDFMAIADTLAPTIRRAFLQAVRELRAAADAPAVLRWIQSHSARQAADEIVDGLQGGFDGLHRAMADAILNTGKKFVPGTIAHVDLRNTPRFEQIVRTDALGPIREISDQTRDTIAIEIERGLREGLNPAEIARAIRPLIGLTEAQARAVENYKQELLSQSAAALDRQLRDRRFDTAYRSAIAGERELSDERRAQMVQRYAERFLAYRAETIARTESLRALHAGQRLAWQGMIDDGHFHESDLRRFWHVAHDERTCEVCNQIPVMNPDGVAFNGLFDTPVGPVLNPLMHPNCRCTVFVKPMPSVGVTKFVAKKSDRGRYIARRVTPESAEYIRRWMLPDDALADHDLDPDPHVTQMYSTTDFPHVPSTGAVEASVNRVGVLGDDNAVVLFLDPSPLDVRFNQLVQAGATPTYATYQPHVTLFYLGADWDGSKDAWAAKPPPRDLIRFGPEVSSHLDEEAFSKKGNPHHDAKGRFTSFEHYSPKPDLTTLDPAKQGTGRAGKERWRTDRPKAIHVYLDGARLEPQFRNDYRYTGKVESSKLYDLAADPEHLRNPLNASRTEKNIKNAGYHGYTVGKIAKLFVKTPVTPVKPRTYNGHTFGAARTAMRPTSAGAQLHKFDASEPRDDHGRWSAGIAEARAYSDDAYYPVNWFLRYGEYPKDAKPADVARAPGMIDTLDHLFAHAPPTTTETTLWRGLRSRHTAQWEQVGNIVSDAGYVSTSTWAGKAEDFAKPTARADGTVQPRETMLKITVPSGSRVLDFSHDARFTHEHEVLLPRGAQFRVDKIERPNSWSQTIHATYLGTTHAQEHAA